MTTNVRDSITGVLATDSRWTWSTTVNGHAVEVHLDDAGYEKLIAAHEHVFMFAGSSVVIESWKQAIKQASYSGVQPDWSTLDVNGMAISMVRVPDAVLTFESGHDITVEKVSFAGTGSYAAAGCWVSNRCAKKAVETAKLSDKFTGGTVRYSNVHTSEGNLVPDSDLGSLVKKFLGSASMTSNDVTHATVFGEVAQDRSLAANDEALRAALAKSFAAGQGPVAPCDAVFREWPAEEKARLVKAMQQAFAN